VFTYVKQVRRRYSLQSVSHVTKTLIECFDDASLQTQIRTILACIYIYMDIRQFLNYCKFRVKQISSRCVDYQTVMLRQRSFSFGKLAAQLTLVLSLDVSSSTCSLAHFRSCRSLLICRNRLKASLLFLFLLIFSYCRLVMRARAILSSFVTTSKLPVTNFELEIDVRRSRVQSSCQSRSMLLTDDDSCCRDSGFS
jgi:hypothetical protein